MKLLDIFRNEGWQVSPVPGEDNFLQLISPIGTKMLFYTTRSWLAFGELSKVKSWKTYGELPDEMMGDEEYWMTPTPSNLKYILSREGNKKKLIYGEFRLVRY